MLPDHFLIVILAYFYILLHQNLGLKCMPSITTIYGKLRNLYNKIFLWLFKKNAPNYERFCSNLNNQSSRYANSQALDENQYSNYYSYKSSRGSNSTRSRQSNDYFRTNNHVYNEDSRNLYSELNSYSILLKL